MIIFSNLYFPFNRRPGISSLWRDLLEMLPQHLKQIRVLMLNDKENLQRNLFRLEQGNASLKHFTVLLFHESRRSCRCSYTCRHLPHVGSPLPTVPTKKSTDMFQNFGIDFVPVHVTSLDTWEKVIKKYFKCLTERGIWMFKYSKKLFGTIIWHLQR